MKAILFGSIGVLAETSALQRNAFNAAFEACGLDWYWNVANYCELLKQPGGVRRIVSFSNGKISIDQARDIHHHKEKFYKEYLKDGIAPRDGIADCIKACRAQGIKLGLVTTTTANNISILKDALSRQINFDDFDLITTKADIDHEKPDGEVYQFALRKLGLLPDEVIAIEDTEVNQEAALTEQIMCFLYAGEYAATRHNLNSIKNLDLIMDKLS